MGSERRLRVLLIIEQCNPDWPSVPYVGYQLFKHIAEFADVTLVTHARNEAAIRRRHPDLDLVVTRETRAIAIWHRVATRLSTVGGHTVWPLYHTLTFPTYAQFDRQVRRLMARRVRDGEFDVVHAITPMIPRFPYGIHSACKDTPFVIGPVNGGVPYPDAFKDVARAEFSYLNALRIFGRKLVSGYRATYEAADYIFSGSQFTKTFLEHEFRLKNAVEVLAENGIEESVLAAGQIARDDAARDVLEVLFAGRLVPYKGADLVVEALGKLKAKGIENVRLSVAGDGPEREALEQRTAVLGLQNLVGFKGWVRQDEMGRHYRAADVFCFPSVREFGGAVVLEAMANGLPSIVVNNGGIAEYVTPECAFIIEPTSREAVIEEIAARLGELARNRSLIGPMAAAARARARGYTWQAKASRIAEVYRECRARGVAVGEPRLQPGGG